MRPIFTFFTIMTNMVVLVNAQIRVDNLPSLCSSAELASVAACKEKASSAFAAFTNSNPNATPTQRCEATKTLMSTLQQCGQKCEFTPELLNTHICLCKKLTRKSELSKAFGVTCILSCEQFYGTEKVTSAKCDGVISDPKPTPLPLPPSLPNIPVDFCPTGNREAVLQCLAKLASGLGSSNVNLGGLAQVCNEEKATSAALLNCIKPCLSNENLKAAMCACKAAEKGIIGNTECNLSCTELFGTAQLPSDAECQKPSECEECVSSAKNKLENILKAGGEKICDAIFQAQNEFFGCSRKCGLQINKSPQDFETECRNTFGSQQIAVSINGKSVTCSRTCAAVYAELNAQPVASEGAVETPKPQGSSSTLSSMASLGISTMLLLMVTNLLI